MSDKILIVGAGGQVGQALKDLLGSHAIIVGRAILDLSKPAAIRTRILDLKPDIVINAAAYTKVDLAEREEQLAYTINAESAFELARACHEVGASFVTFSTDYVYSGFGEKPWSEEDPVQPQNAYGRTKAAGEKLIADWAPADFKYLILRTSWIYSYVGKNFLLTMLGLGSQKEELKVVGDQVGAPTFAPHLALATLAALDKLTPENSGIYNCAAGGETSWFEFAEEIFEEAALKGFNLKLKNLISIPTSEYITPAKRPLNSRLNQSLLRERFDIELPHWTHGLSECMNELEKNEG